MELILIRHSITQGNKERRFIGVTDIPLALEGETLARQAASSLPAVDHVYRSPLLRCRQTAALLWPGTEETVIEELREMDFGPFEGKNHEELKDDPLYQKYISGADLGRIPVGETLEQVTGRVSRGLAPSAADAAARGFERVAAVTHGGVVMALMWAFGRPARAGFYDWKTANCGGFRVRVRKPLALDILEALKGEEP